MPLLNIEQQPAYCDDLRQIYCYQADAIELMTRISQRYTEGLFDMIFADPPYFLSDGGVTCHSGRMVCVDKGEWDRAKDVAEMHQFNLTWLALCQKLLKRNGTIWITGTHHVIFSVGHALQSLGYKILNVITWEKPNPPPNLSCRYFTHSTETVIWAARSERSRHYFNYELMKTLAGQRQMKTVWRLYPASSSEKRLGKHPTQKPLGLVRRCLLASTREGDLVLDPFLGSGTTAVACALERRACVGIEQDPRWVQLAVKRIEHEGKEQPWLVAV